MKFGVRKPSVKRSIKARTTGRAKRAIKKSVNPMYGKKGMGMIKNPKKSVYNKVYNKTTVDSLSSLKKRPKTGSSNFVSTSNQNEAQLSNKTTGLGCVAIIGVVVSIFNPVLFLVTIPLLIYAMRKVNKEAKQIEEAKKDISDGDLDVDVSIDVESFETEAEINRIYSKELEGLLIGEIILLDWLHGKATSSTPPQYFAYTYGINYNHSIEKLRELGYIRLGMPSESLVNLKVAELKQILARHELKVSGRKAELIERIQKNIPEEAYQEEVKEVWTVSETGKNILEKYDLLVWGHKNQSADGVVDPASLLSYINDTRANEEIALAISEFEFRKNIQNVNYGFAINNLRYQIKLKEQLKLYEEAFDLLLKAAVLELTGIGNANGYDVYFYEGAVYTDHLKTQLIKYQDLLDLSAGEIIERAREIYGVIEPQLHDVKLYQNQKEFLSALNVLISGTKEEMDDQINEWFERVPDEYKL